MAINSQWKPAALHLRAMNIIYENHQGARRHHPDADLDGGFDERRTAGGGDDAGRPAGERRLELPLRESP
jgi:hypothetical protein